MDKQLVPTLAQRLRPMVQRPLATRGEQVTRLQAMFGESCDYLWETIDPFALECAEQCQARLEGINQVWNELRAELPAGRRFYLVDSFQIFYLVLYHLSARR